MAVQINVAANQAALMQSISAGVQAYNQRFANQNQINLQVNARAFSQPLGRITGDVKDFEAALAASNARVIAFGASTAILGGVIRGFKSIAEITTEVEKNLTDINRVFGLTTKELQKFSTDLFNVSKQTASSFKDASQAALEFSRQGVKAEQVLQRTTDALTLARLAGMNVGNAIEALTATVNGFATTGITTTQVLNKLVAVEQNYAVSAGDLAEALSRTGLAAQEAGVSIDELNALVTAAQEKTARGGAVIGNALKTIFTRLQRPETLDQLEQFNIAVRDVQGNILPATQILKNFAGAYQSLADSQRAQLSEQVAGVYQVNILKAIVSDLNSTQGAYNGALTKGTNATNEAQLATAKLNQSLDALLSQTSTVAQQFANNIGKVTFEPLAKYTAETFKSLFENLNEILEGEGLGSTFANGLLKGIRNILAGPGAIGAFFVLAKLLQNSFSYLTQALPQIVGITTETQNRKNIEAAILQILQGQSIEAQALQGQMGNQAAQAQLLLQIARQQTAEYQRQQALVASLAPQLSRQGVVVGGSGGGLRVTRSKGFLPNFEESSAKSQGATSSVKAVKGVGKIGGKSFIANNQEIQIPNFAGSGETAVIPTYGGGLQKAIGMIGNGKSGSILSNGFVPNFAEGKRVGDKVLYVLDDPYRIIDGDTIESNAAIQNVQSFRLSGVDAIEPNQRLSAQATNLAKQIHPNAKSFTDTIDPSGSAAWNRGLFVSDKLSVSLLRQGLGVPDLRYGENIKQEYNKEVQKAIIAERGIWADPILQNGKNVYTHPKAIQYMGMFKSKQDFEKSFSTYKSEKILTEQRKKLAKNYSYYSSLGQQGYSSGFIPNFGYAGADVIRQAVESGNIEQFRMPGTKTFKFPSGTASEAQVNNIAQRATKGTPGQAGALTYKGSYNFDEKEISSPDGKQLIDLAYENLVKSQIPSLISAHDHSINFSLPFTGGPNSYIDFFDPNSKTFYEAKGGTYSDSEVANKFQNARIDLNNQLNKQLQNWKNTLVYDPNYASKGFIPNFASVLKTMGRTVRIENISSEGRDTLGSQYDSIFAKLQKNKIKNVVGTLSRQLGNDPKENTPVSQVKAIIPQIIRGRQGVWSTLSIGNNTFDFNSKTFDLELEKNAPQILSALNGSNAEVGLETYLTKKSKQKPTTSSTTYDDLKRSLGLDGGFIPNFNAIKGRNIFQSKWLKEKAKTLGLDINNPDVMQTLGALFAKSYPNQQMMFGFGKGFIPNFVDPKLFNEIIAKAMMLPNGKNIADKLKEGSGLSNDAFRKAAQKLGVMTSPAVSAYAFLPEFDLSNKKKEYIKTFISDLKKKGLSRVSLKLGKNDSVMNETDFGLKFKSQGIMGYSDFDLLSKGFLPNFAYKNAVMNLEENLSGQNAILDNTTGPFPFIRNSSQPNFAAAIKDHGGLNQALNDSYRNQVSAGLMNGGFVPNFAAKSQIPAVQLVSPGLIASNQQSAKELNNLNIQIKNFNLVLKKLTTDFKLTDQEFNQLRSQAETAALALAAQEESIRDNLKNPTSLTQGYQAISAIDQMEAPRQRNRQSSQNRRQVNQQRIDKFMNTAMFAIPMIAGQFESAVFGNRQRTEMTAGERMGQSALSTGLTSISTGANIGNMILPGIGGIVGGIAGSLFGLTQAFDAVKLSTEELSQVFSEQQQKAQESISTGNSYIDAQKQLTDMIVRGASSTEIENATKKLSDNFMQIKDAKLQEEFLKAGGDLSIMTKQLQQYTNQATKRSAFGAAITGKTGIEQTVSSFNVAFSGAGEKEKLTNVIKKIQDISKPIYEIFESTGDFTGYLTAVKQDIKTNINDQIVELLAIGGITPDMKEFEDSYSKFIDAIIKNPEKAIELLKKSDIVTKINEQVAKLNKVATESFVNIFKQIEETFQIAAFQTAMQFERESSGQRINASVLEFTSSFNESLSSFLMSNIPDYARAGLIQQTARQKAELAQQKLTQDYAAFETKQSKERADALRVNAEDLTKAFKESMLNSQENAQYFRDQILGQLQAGNYNVNIGTVAKNMQEARISQFRGIVGAQGNLSNFSNLDLTNEQAINDFRTQVSNLMIKGVQEASTQQAKDEITKKFNDILRSLNAAISASEFAKNTNAQEDVRMALKEKQRKLTEFDIAQANAEKELQIQQQLQQAKIIAEMKYATEKAKIDEENMMRLQAMKTVLENLSNQQKLVQAQGDASIAAIQRQLNDPRQEFFMGGAERVARRNELENQMMEKRFEMENKSLDAEIQQAAIQIAVEQENTNALLALNTTIAQFTSALLEESLGGAQAIADIRSRESEMGPFAATDVDLLYGKGTFAKYQAYKMAQQQSMPVNYSELTGKYETAFSKLQQEGFSKKGITVAEQQGMLQKKINDEQDVVMKQMYQRLLKRSQTEKQILDYKQEQVRAEREMNEELSEGKYNFKFRLESGFANMSVAADDMIMELTETAPARFADGMTSALMEVAKGTKSIGDAFTDMAINFGQMLMEAVMKAAIYKTIGSIGGGFFQSGGEVQKMRTGGFLYGDRGMSVPGIGTGDKVPTMLEPKEYVLNSRLVQMIGKDKLDYLNYKVAPRFGGGTGISGMRRGGLIGLQGGGFGFEAQQGMIGDKLDYTGNLLKGNNQVAAINEADYTAMALAEDPYFQGVKEKAYERYKQSIIDEYNRKVKNAQFISSMVGAVGSISLAYGMSGLGKAGMRSGKLTPASTPSGPSAIQISQLENAGVNMGDFGSNGIALPQMQTGGQIKGFQRGGLVGYQSGGSIPYGSRLTDTLPKYMTGGNIIDTPLVKRVGNLSYNMMQNGGSSSSSSNTYNQSENNATNISINIAGDGTATGASAKSNSYKPEKVKMTKKMAKEIEAIATNAISKQQRNNGLLGKTRSM